MPLQLFLCFWDRFRNTFLSYWHFFLHIISSSQWTLQAFVVHMWPIFLQKTKHDKWHGGGNCYTLVACMYSQCRSFYVYESKQSFKPDNWIKQLAWAISIARPMFHGMLLDAFFWKTRLIRICSHRYGNKLVTQKLWTMTTRFHGKSGADSSFLRYRHCKSCECIQILSWFRERYTWQCKH